VTREPKGAYLLCRVLDSYDDTGENLRVQVLMKEEAVMTISVDVTSDVICPWCFIGKRRLEKAVAAWQAGHDVRVRWHPFQLNPRIPKGGMNRKEYRTTKFGSWERSLELDAQVTAAGKEEGITFAFDKIIRTPNTLAGRSCGGGLPSLLHRRPGH
jgi:DSBA-like thioredoxin domain